MAHEGALKTNNSHLYIGHGRTGGYPWKGAVDEVMLLDKALTAKEISDLYQYFSLQ